jgi:hypothetical protein
MHDKFTTTPTPAVLVIAILAPQGVSREPKVLFHGQTSDVAATLKELLKDRVKRQFEGANAVCFYEEADPQTRFLVLHDLFLRTPFPPGNVRIDKEPQDSEPEPLHGHERQHP